MTQNNFMQHLPGGHCFACHKDFTEEGDEHFFNTCPMKGTEPTPERCLDECKDSKYVYPPGI